MADEESVESGAATAVADRPATEDVAPAPSKDDGKKKRKKKDEDDLEYEVEFATPFGKLEFEFEPLDKKAKKDADRKAKAERAAAKKAMALAKAAERAPKAGGSTGGGPSRLLVTLLVIGVIGGAIIIAYWLFARPGEEENEVIPPEFANAPEPVAQGFAARARSRLSEAIRAGRKASRDAQREQREKFERMTGARSAD
jgi:hypothetical protein